MYEHINIGVPQKEFVDPSGNFGDRIPAQYGQSVGESFFDLFGSRKASTEIPHITAKPNNNWIFHRRRQGFSFLPKKTILNIKIFLDFWLF